MMAAGAWAVLARPAAAHGADQAGGFGWTLDPVLLLPLVGTGILFAAGTIRLAGRTGRWPRGRRIRALAFALGWLALVLALASPLHQWGEHLFTAHMVEHELIMAVAAPLLVLASPLGTGLWALPSVARRAVGAVLRGAGLRAGWTALVHPVSATAQHAVVLWLWHAPILFEASLASENVHRLQHVLFLASAVIFWWSMLRRASPGEAFGHLSLTMLQMSVLGALIALAPRVVYPLQTEGAPLAGLTPLADQQLAGLVMWVPAGTLYAGAALAFAALWIRRSGETSRRRQTWRTRRGLA